MNINLKIIIFFFIILTIPNVASSYFDPGSGSYLIQLFIAFIASCYFFLTNPIQSIKNFFKKNKKDDEENKDKPED
tara:strand:+ start:53 stop:280 length:228 start_codon:yes stop_codon:yes gene_type:complete